MTKTAHTLFDDALHAGVLLTTDYKAMPDFMAAGAMLRAREGHALTEGQQNTIVYFLTAPIEKAVWAWGLMEKSEHEAILLGLQTIHPLYQAFGLTVLREPQDET